MGMNIPSLYDTLMRQVTDAAMNARVMAGKWVPEQWWPSSNVGQVISNANRMFINTPGVQGVDYRMSPTILMPTRGGMGTQDDETLPF